MFSSSSVSQTLKQKNEKRSVRSLILSASDFIQELFVSIQNNFVRNEMKVPLTQHKTPPTYHWSQPKETPSLNQGSTAEISITIFSASDPDSVCAVYLLQNALINRLGLQLRLIVVSCYGHLRRAFSVEASRKSSSLLINSPCFILINVGGRYDVRKFLKEFCSVRLFILDSSRPLVPSYIEDPEIAPIIVTAEQEIQTIEQNQRRIEKFFNKKPESDSDEELDDENDKLFRLFRAVPKEGEYFSFPIALVVFEALRAQNLDEPCSYFVTASGVAFCFLTGLITRSAYCEHMENLLEMYDRAKQRFASDDRRFQLICVERKEVTLPLLRFTTIEESLSYSLALLRTSFFSAHEGILAQELAHLRVQLGLDEIHWTEQFRLLRPREQYRFTHRTLPRVLQRLTTSSRRRLKKRYPDDEDMTGIITAPVFLRELRAVGLPHCLSSIDLALLLLGLLTKPSFPQKVSGIDFTDTDSDTFRKSDQLYNQLDDSACFEALELLQSLDFQNNILISSSSAVRSTTLECQNPLSLAYPWDTYVSFQRFQEDETLLEFHATKSLASLAKIVLHIHQEAVLFCVRLLRSRTSGCSENYRRVSWNVEGFLDTSMPSLLFHPLWVQYISCILSDAISKGVYSAAPCIVLFLSLDRISEEGKSFVIAYKPAADILDPRQH